MTRANAVSNALLNELAALLRLTRAEAQIARVRISQARREEIRRELEENADEADRRAGRLQETLRRLGGTPDVLGDTVGRVTALTKVTAEQVQPFSEGLLGDLALEHQLRDRVIFTRVLAESQDESSVVELMSELEQAHTETIGWIRLRLAELAQGGPVALAPTPTQAAVSAVARFATLPSRQGAAAFNKAADVLQRGRGNAQQALGSTRKKARQTAEATGEVVTAGRDAALARAEEVAPSAELRKAAREAREDLGTIEAEDLPISEYDALSGIEAIAEVNGLESAEDVRVVLQYELAHKDRKGVSTAAQKRLTELGKESINAAPTDATVAGTRRVPATGRSRAAPPARRCAGSTHGLLAVDGLAQDVGVTRVLCRLGHDVHEDPAGTPRPARLEPRSLGQRLSRVEVGCQHQIVRGGGDCSVLRQ
jgi:bacterioferritin (cytochrome b1)